MGHICAAGLADVAQIVDFEGVWSRDLVELFLPVAIEIEADRVDAMRRGVLGGVAGVMSKNGSRAFDKQIGDVRKFVRKYQRAARGLAPEEGETTADQFLGILRQLGWKGEIKGGMKPKERKAGERFRNKHGR